MQKKAKKKIKYRHEKESKKTKLKKKKENVDEDVEKTSKTYVRGEWRQKNKDEVCMEESS